MKNDPSSPDERSGSKSCTSHTTARYHKMASDDSGGGNLDAVVIVMSITKRKQTNE